MKCLGRRMTALALIAFTASAVADDTQNKTGQAPLALAALKAAALEADLEKYVEEAAPAPSRHIKPAHKLARLLQHASAGETFDNGSNCKRDTLGRPDPFCGVRWRRSDALSDLRTQYSSVNRGLKNRVFGKALARHIELDLDSSPKIQFRYDFD